MIQSIMLIVISTLLIIVELEYLKTKKEFEVLEKLHDKNWQEKIRVNEKNFELEMKMFDKEKEANELRQTIKAMLYSMEDNQIKIELKTLNKEINGDICVQDDVMRYSKIIKLMPKWKQI